MQNWTEELKRLPPPDRSRVDGRRPRCQQDGGHRDRSSRGEPDERACGFEARLARLTLVVEALREIFNADPRIAYALLFGSRARGAAHRLSDIDIAVGVSSGQHLDALAVGDLVNRIERATGVKADLVLLENAPPGLAYRVFRDAAPIAIRDQQAFKSRLARAILEYLDFKPIEEIFTRGVLRARHGR